MSFRISSLPKTLFEHLFDLPAVELASHRAVRMVADKKPGYPCRVSLADAEVGEEVILVNFEHQAADTPFRSSHAIYVRPGAVQAQCGEGEVPAVFRSRTLSLRGFDHGGMLIAADLAEGTALEGALEAMLENPRVGYIHLHFAKPGCFAARVDRAAA